MPRFDAYGRMLRITRSNDEWDVRAEGADGTLRDARVRIPASVPESELAEFLADLFHESATPERPDVVRLD